MRLASFIRVDTQRIVDEWESFARTLVPAAEGMSPLALRDHITDILAFIADDIESTQTNCEQIEKSHGEKRNSVKYSAAQVHASLRQAGGFDMDQMVSEFRALRASVIKLWGMQATLLDVTDLIRFNESIDQALTESIGYYMDNFDNSRILLLGILGHDLCNPLAAARMSAELALKLGALSERQAMLISQIVESTDRASSIVLSLLDLTRARLGSGLPIIKEHMDMGFVGRQLVDEMRAMHPDRQCTLEILGETGGEWDKPRIGQVFANLLGNAVRYGFKGVPVGVMIKGCSTEVSLVVHNEGVPIPSSVAGRIFDPFTRGGVMDAASYSRSTNLGLGLYIVKEIVSAHDGTIGVSSSEKDGTTFTVQLPRSLP